MIEKAAVEAAREHDVLLERARAEAQALEAETRRQLERERAEFNDTVIAEAAKIAVEIARRLLAATNPATPLDPFIDRAASKLAAMPAAERNRLLLDGEGLTFVSAESISEKQRSDCAARISAALGRKVPISFVESPDLIAGIELRFPRAVLRHNWHDDLADALKDLVSKDIALKDRASA